MVYLYGVMQYLYSMAILTTTRNQTHQSPSQTQHIADNQPFDQSHGNEFRLFWSQGIPTAH